MIEVIPLGTGSALPSTDRHYSSTVVQQENRLFLFDCGEGTQFQFLHADLRLSRLEAIFITHLHGDHYFGLPGLLSTLTLLNHERPLKIVGPTGLQAFLSSIPSRKKSHEPTLKIEFIEIEPGSTFTTVYESDLCRVTSRPLTHSVQTAGYRFDEKDRPGNLDIERARELGLTHFTDYRALKSGVAVTTPEGRLVNPSEVVSAPHPGASFAYVTDTLPCDNGKLLSQNANLVYHEATFIETDKERAVQTMHSTAREAAIIAQEACVERLLIGHFSGRYKSSSVLIEEARTVFKNTDAAEELKRYTLSADVASTENMS